MRAYLVAAAALALGLGAGVAQASEAGNEQASQKSGKQLAQTCVACHGPGGAEPIQPAYPKLAGQHADYLLHALKAYKNGMAGGDNLPFPGHGVRNNPIMAGQVANLSETDMEKLAEYFADQQSVLYTPQTD